MNGSLLKLACMLLKEAQETLTVAESKEMLVNAMREAKGEIHNSAISIEMINKINAGLMIIIGKLIEYVINDNTNPGVSGKHSGKITLYQRKPEYIFQEDTDAKNRVVTTLGRYIKRRFLRDVDPTVISHKKEYNVADVFDDQMINLFVNETNAVIASYMGILEKGVAGVSGEEVVETYERFEDSSSTQSCMTGGDCSKMKLLANNPDKVSLLNMDGKARALFWTADDGTRILDRIYPSGSKYINLFRKWADKNGYVYRKNPDSLVDENETVELSSGDNYIVTLDARDIEEFPYLDTFRYGEFDGDKLKLSNNYNFGKLTFVRDDGGYNEGTPCADCGTYFDDELGGTYVNSVGSVCEDCLEEAYSTCGDCEEYYKDEDLVTPEGSFSGYCEYCIDNNAIRCSECEDLFSPQASGSIEGPKGEVYCPICVESMEECHNCDMPLPGGGEEINGKFYCDDCFEKFKKE